ncbi:MAG TPA: class I SAM-dependent methyltransferase [Humisphaera sp.]
MTTTPLDLESDAAPAAVEQLEWFHSVEVAPGVVTPGRKSPEVLAGELAALRLPDLTGKSVLDIGAYDGFFSFAAERLGAARVVALDHYVWSADMAGYMADWRASHRTGESLPAPHESRHWDPVKLPGRRPFDTARRLLGSRVEPVVGDLMTMDLTSLGRFDVVLYLGVLYHMEEPLTAMRRVAAVTAPGGLAVVQTNAMEIAGAPDLAFCRFLPGRELGNDPTNWWLPNSRAIEGLCTAAGFARAAVLNPPPATAPVPVAQPLGPLARLLVRSGLAARLGFSFATTPNAINATAGPAVYSAFAHAHR